jgi:hypothetical protein
MRSMPRCFGSARPQLGNVVCIVPLGLNFLALVHRSTSERQKNVVNDASLESLDRTTASESLRAMARDVERLGFEAFDAPPRDEPGQ